MRFYSCTRLTDRLKYYINVFHAGIFFLFFWLSADFFKIKNKNTIIVSNSLDPDQARRFDGPGVGPNCFLKVVGRQRVKHLFELVWMIHLASLGSAVAQW